MDRLILVPCIRLNDIGQDPESGELFYLDGYGQPLNGLHEPRPVLVYRNRRLLEEAIEHHKYHIGPRRLESYTFPIGGGQGMRIDQCPVCCMPDPVNSMGIPFKGLHPITSFLSVHTQTDLHRQHLLWERSVFKAVQARGWTVDPATVQDHGWQPTDLT